VALTLVRHTRPRGEGVCYGGSEVELAASFPEEAAALAARLDPPARIVTSPLGRCRRLADFLGARLGAPVAADPRWREMDFGAWEGARWDDIPRAELDAWAHDLMEARPHGGESVAMLLARTRAALRDCRKDPGTCLVVTHAGVIRAALFDAGEAGAWQRPIGFGESVSL
jgi:alpha-ribazole phosphatase